VRIAQLYSPHTPTWPIGHGHLYDAFRPYGPHVNARFLTRFLAGGYNSRTRQKVFYFGTPAGDARFADEALPVWADLSDRKMYGIPGNVNRGFKLADDTPGPAFDPTNGHRDVTAAGLKSVRAFLARRFPALAKAPLVGSEVCQYEATPDSDYIFDRHPGAPNVWLVGGGSGHGFKMGPAVGELVASLVLGDSQPDPYFSLARFARRSARRSIEKWS
jgi:sarcosine oxidase